MKIAKVAAATILFACASMAFAAKPTSITFASEGTSPDGQDYASYVVKCSNGQEQNLTAWDSRKRWCVGDMSQENCDRKQINAAKAACK